MAKDGTITTFLKGPTPGTFGATAEAQGDLMIENLGAFLVRKNVAPRRIRYPVAAADLTSSVYHY